MITYIKYPVKKEHLLSCKVPMFTECVKLVDKGSYIVAYPDKNNLGFYCKSMDKKDVFRFKGKFNIERCSVIRVLVARKWYFETGQDLPRKTKKLLISTKKKAIKLSSVNKLKLS